MRHRLHHISCLIFFFVLFKMPRGIRDHEANRRLICAACGRKNLKCIRVGASLEDAIKQQVHQNYAIAETKFPNGVCPTCKCYLFLAKKKGKSVIPDVRLLWNVDYDSFCPPL